LVESQAATPFGCPSPALDPTDARLSISDPSRRRLDRARRQAGEGVESWLEELRIELDRCWDLLRQRQGREEFGLDPENVHARDADTVENYEQ
jgi:hypothetical protein